MVEDEMSRMLGIQVAESSDAPKTPKKMKPRPNPLFVNPISPLSLDLSARVPSELHDYIIDHLHNDRRSLCVCSLVCKAWYGPSVYHLFRNAAIIRVDRHKFLPFCHLLATQRLNAYIGCLDLESHVIDEVFEDEISDGGPHVTLQFNEHLGRLRGLTHLKYLRLHYHHDSVSPSFFSALAENFSSVTDLELSSVHFDSFKQFTQVRNALPLLRRLSLVSVIWYNAESDTEDEVETHSYDEPGNLVEVVLQNCLRTSIFTWLASNPLIRRLQVGRMRHRVHVPLLSDILRKLGPCLQHLVVHDSDHLHLLDLSHSTALRTFQITDIVCSTSRILPELPWVPALLSQLHSRTLERIVLVLELRDRGILPLLNWQRIAELLDGMAPNLQSVAFSLSSHVNWASKFIDEQLSPRTYALRVDQWERRYQYALSV
ncbi:hypothetical protein B0H11DRAFT_1116695 [Mycena galericulata]|nr:hypothetical protein B0H11DRAFT_1116695 [Mycena galericulata]